MTVAQLIEKLKAMPQSLEVERADCIPIKDVYVEEYDDGEIMHVVVVD